MKISIEHEQELTIVKVLETRLDASLAPEFKTQMEEIVSSGKLNIILDISNLTFMDSSSLGAMVVVLKMMGNNGKLLICGAKGIVSDLFTLTRMDRVFNMQENLIVAKETFLVDVS